ncbi:MAG TPA: tetratricopeptide repeat protein [Xanthobacteraceae bacterium]|nr:tetratricopeptide repeat protein [Xanthobacteraceae bacterium]
MAERTLRIFVSSPSDVAAERGRVKLVADRFNAQLEGIVRIEVLRWEDAFYTAAHSFQEAIDGAIGNMAATDMVLCIVWKRAGLKLNPAIWRRPDGSAYESGTVLEFETAVDVSRKQNGVPDVFLFRKAAPVVYEADRVAEQLEQHELLQAVWKRWTESDEGYNTAGYQSFADPDEFEVKLAACLQQWLERKGVVARGPHWDRKLRGSPFRGLAAFEASHTGVFFGREAAISRAVAKLRQSPFLLVIGASGSGKSSLLRAGLIPRATAPGVIPDVDLWRTVVVSAGGDPFTALADALFADDALGAELRAGDFTTPQALAGLFEGGSAAAVAPLRSALARAARARKDALRYEELRPVRLLLALDQVERLFVEATPERVEAFAKLLRAMVEAGLASLVAMLRSDTYGRFQTVPSFLALLESSGATFDLLPPSPTELEEIVSRPVAACHPPLAYETDARGRSLAEALVADAHGGDALPLLQMTLQRLFDAEAARGDGVLRFADYPGLDVAVARTAEEALAGLDARAVSLLPALMTAFVRDVTFGTDGAIETLTIVPVEREAFERGDPVRRALIDEFISRRLLTTEEAGGVVRLRPVHEALLRVVPAAVAIIKENAALIRVRNTLAPMAAEWSQEPADRKPDFLATSPALIAGAAQLDERFGAELPASMRAFIAESLAADARRRDAERSRQRRILAATAAGLVVALALAGVAGWQWRVAAEQRQLAEIQRARAANSLAAATRTTDTLIFDLAQEFRRRTGMPVDLTRLILERVQGLQRQLSEAGERSSDLLRLESAALDELASLYLDQGDIKAALQASERGRAILQAMLDADPGNQPLKRELGVALNRIGDARLALGEAAEALASFEPAFALIGAIAAANPGNAGLQRDLSATINKLADALTLLGRRTDALALYRKSLAVIEAVARSDATNLGWQSDIAFTEMRVGSLLAIEGQREEALAAYRRAAVIREALAARLPESSERQRDRSTILMRIGDLLLTMGRNKEALTPYRSALAVMEKLSESDPGNLQWWRDVAIIEGQIAGALAQRGEIKEALASYQRSLAISQKLLDSNPDNVQWLRDVAVAHNKIGDVLRSSGRREDALKAYQASLEIAEKLVAGNPKVVEWQRDLAISLVRVGDTIAATDRPAARASYERSRAIRERLAADDPGNLVAQRDVSLIHDRIGNIFSDDERYEDALVSYRSSLAIRAKVAAADPANFEAERDIAVSHDLVGTALFSLKRPDEAVKEFRAGLAVIERYAARNLDNPRWQIDLALALNKLAFIGDQPRARLERALAILRKLDGAGQLAANQKGWIQTLEEGIAALPK